MLPEFYVTYDGWAILVLRLVLGIIFVVHGLPKFRDLKKNAKDFDGMGFKPGMLFGTIAGLLEFFGGLAIILGFYATWVAIPLALEFMVILVWRWVKHMPFKGGWEFDLLMLSGFFILFSLGSGIWSLDRLFLGIF